MNECDKPLGYDCTILQEYTTVVCRLKNRSTLESRIRQLISDTHTFPCCVIGAGGELLSDVFPKSWHGEESVVMDVLEVVESVPFLQSGGVIIVASFS